MTEKELTERLVGGILREMRRVAEAPIETDPRKAEYQTGYLEGLYRAEVIVLTALEEIKEEEQSGKN